MVSDKQSTDVNSYLEKLPPDRRAVLESLRQMILQIAPEAQQTMQYGMPVFEYPGGSIALAAQKNYFSLYMDVNIVERHRAELGSLSVGKSCIRFKRLDQLPLDTIRKMMEESAGGRPS